MGSFPFAQNFMRSHLLILGCVFAVAAAVPRTHAPEPVNQPNADLLPMHSQAPFLSRNELQQMPREHLVQLVLELTGQSAEILESLGAEEQDDKGILDENHGWPPFWPYPAQFVNGTQAIPVDANLQFTVAVSSDDVDAAVEQFKNLVFTHSSVQSTSPQRLLNVKIDVINPVAELQLETEESYTLTISVDGNAKIQADTQLGVFHALQTLSQLIIFDFDSKTFIIPAAPWTINDFPRFKHRELLVDTSRHFLPLATIRTIIDSMTYAKLNVMHWHIVDSQSFPFDSPSYPNLSKFGAYSAYERFTTDDVASIVEYSRSRGVRVVVEIDNPGHAGSWCTGYPEVCPSLTCREPLNPSTEATFTLLSGLFHDLTGGIRGQGLFPDHMFHLGGDEVNTACWTQSASISQWMAANNYTVDEAYYYFVGRAQTIARGMGRDVIGWEEIWNHFGTRLDKSTIIQQWLPGSTVAEQCVQNGYRVIWSTDGVWYLDGLGVTWQTMYIQEPCINITDSLCSQYMLGGGGEMWGETADTSDVLQTIWPRAGAIAERLWSPRTLTNTTSAAPRFAAFRCLLNRRGIAAAPISNKSARTAPPGPGGCFAQ
eukprot:c8892_g1_i1.p1 GENE.c8892_g1_i1~~c8892_g1_i1.p1  ORF type:complete len:599 (-),score=133.54 c8892_g1_i1:177-1973(-)